MFLKILKPNIPARFHSTYEIPERYRNSFYLANAALFDQVNWFLHRAYEICFPRLLVDLKDREPKLSDADAIKQIVTVVQMLDQCNSIIDVRFPIQRENGNREVIRGFRAQYGLYSGFHTCLGGLRMKEDLTRDQMKALAALSTYKHACMGIRLAGAHGGIKIDPTQYTESELERIVKKYAGELYLKGFCDGQNDVIEPDINVGGREMDWIASVFPDKHDKFMVTGKNPDIGGFENFSKMVSQGVFFALDYFVSQDNVLESISWTKKGLEAKTFMIQGFGPLGSAITEYLVNSGAICIGIKEPDEYLHDPHGIDIEAAIKHKREFGSLENFSNAKSFGTTKKDILREECDILILTEQQKSLICYDADKIKAKVVVEASNGVITPTAHRILVSNSKLVLPDIYISSGQAIASYLEYLLALRKSGKELTVIRRIYKHLLDNFDVSKETRQVVSSATTQKIVSCDVNPDVLTYTVEHVMRQTGDELLDIAKDYNLNLDLRIAGYIKAIRSIHTSIYERSK